MSTTSRWASTPAARRHRAVKAQRLAAAAVTIGVVVCELRPSHPDVAARRADVARSAEVRSASSTSWCAAVVALDEHLMRSATRRCGACGSPVREAITPTIARLPIDPLPHPDGALVEQPAPGEHLHLRWPAPGEDLAAAGRRWRSHSLVCPATPEVQHRARRRTRCPACNYPLSPLWADRPKVRIHPTCEEIA